MGPAGVAHRGSRDVEITVLSAIAALTGTCPTPCPQIKKTQCDREHTEYAVRIQIISAGSLSLDQSPISGTLF